MAFCIASVPAARNPSSDRFNLWAACLVQWLLPIARRMIDSNQPRSHDSSFLWGRHRHEVDADQEFVGLARLPEPARVLVVFRQEVALCQARRFFKVEGGERTRGLNREDCEQSCFGRGSPTVQGGRTVEEIACAPNSGVSSIRHG